MDYARHDLDDFLWGDDESRSPTTGKLQVRDVEAIPIIGYPTLFIVGCNAGHYRWSGRYIHAGPDGTGIYRSQQQAKRLADAVRARGVIDLSHWTETQTWQATVQLPPPGATT